MYNSFTRTSIDPSKRTVIPHSAQDNPYAERVVKISGRLKSKAKPGQQDAAARKIQNAYRSYKLKKNFKTCQKPQLEREGNDFIRRQLDLCERGGQVLSMDNYSLDGWKQFYPSNDYFFTGFNKYDNGLNFKTTRVENPDNPEYVKVYQGDMDLNNQKHGFGKLTTPQNVSLGTWRNNQFTGWGIKGKRNGSVIEGKYTENEVNGKGIMRNQKGDVYTGDFVNSQRHGKGELKARRFLYDGDFNNNKMEGNGNIKFTQNGESYNGQFVNNQINGQGTFRWPNGDVYIGEMVNGKRSGNGKYIYANNQIYEGRYVDGKKEGEGKLTYSTHASLIGNFKNGKPEGTVEYFRKNGEKLDVEFEGGRLSRIGGSVISGLRDSNGPVEKPTADNNNNP